MTPDNAFYVLGLSPEATTADIEREGRKLLGLLELGVAKGSLYTCPLGTFSRDATMVREAMSSLRDPVHRARAAALAAILGTAPAVTAAAPGGARASAGPGAPMPEALHLAGYRGL